MPYYRMPMRSVCLSAGLMYDIMGNYTVGFLTVACVALTALVLMLVIYVIDRLAKPSTKTSTLIDVLQPQTADTKC